MRTTRFALITLTGLLAGCGSSYGGGTTAPPPPPPPANTVAATDAITFTPATLNVSVGDIVTFTFGSVPHNVFFTALAGAPADIGGTNANVSIERQFTTAGAFTFQCHIHPSMHGTVVVQ
ncbi:MAG TPA: plastocyanin/azurin family copper-binding protein [Gemmatimonadales bacterium]|nr:plastocyanin/azurin family copper-binding protein [Gemmatimonadales bacterium]